MWEFKNLDVVANSFRGAGPVLALRLAGRFIRFLHKVSRMHPCDLNSQSITNLMFHDGDGDRYVLLLPDNWHVSYRVTPDCSSADGFVEFIYAGPFDEAAA